MRQRLLAQFLVFAVACVSAFALGWTLGHEFAIAKLPSARVAPIVEPSVLPTASRFAKAFCALDAKTMLDVTSPGIGVTPEQAAQFVAERGPAWCDHVATIGGTVHVTTPRIGDASFFLLSGHGQSDWLQVFTDEAGLVQGVSW